MFFLLVLVLCMQGKRPLNRFQGVIITDGSTTFAAFLYSCPNIKWSGLFNKAQVGWQATDSHFRTHPLSGTVNVNEVACLNNASIYTTLLFKLSLVGKFFNTENVVTHTYTHTELLLISLLSITMHNKSKLKVRI